MLLLFLLVKRVQPSKSNRNTLMHANLTLPCSSYSSSVSGSSSWLHLLKSSSYRLLSLPKLTWATPCFPTSLAVASAVKSRSTCIISICHELNLYQEGTSQWWGCLGDTPHHLVRWSSPQQVDGSYWSPHAISLTRHKRTRERCFRTHYSGGG